MVRLFLVLFQPGLIDPSMRNIQIKQTIKATTPSPRSRPINVPAPRIKETPDELIIKSLATIQIRRIPLKAIKRLELEISGLRYDLFPSGVQRSMSAKTRTQAKANQGRIAKEGRQVDRSGMSVEFISLANVSREPRAVARWLHDLVRRFACLCLDQILCLRKGKEENRLHQ